MTQLIQSDFAEILECHYCWMTEGKTRKAELTKWLHWGGANVCVQEICRIQILKFCWVVIVIPLYSGCVPISSDAKYLGCKHPQITINDHHMPQTYSVNHTMCEWVNSHVNSFHLFPLLLSHIFRSFPLLPLTDTRRDDAPPQCSQALADIDLYLLWLLSPVLLIYPHIAENAIKWEAVCCSVH